MKQQQKWSADQFETCLQDKILQYSFHSLYRFIWTDLFSNFIVVGTSAVRFPEQGDSLELY